MKNHIYVGVLLAAFLILTDNMHNTNLILNNPNLIQMSI